MKKILFVAATFYPLNKVSVLRMGQWVKYLAKNGYEVTVLTTKKYSFMGSLDLVVKLPNNVKIVEIDFLPFFLKKTVLTDQINHAGFNDNIYNIKLIVRKIRNYIGNFFDLYDFWINPAYKEALKLYEKERFDFIISSFSPPASHIIAHKVKKKYPKLKWIADFRDLWAYNHIIRAKSFLGVLERYKEKRILKNVDKIITVSKPLSEIMENVYNNKEVYTIENGFDPEEFPNWKKDLIIKPKIKNKLIISYLGTIYPEKRDPSILFEAVNELIDEKIISKEQIEIDFYGDNKKQLEDIIFKKNYNKYKIINIRGFVSRNESLKIQKESDLLLFLEWNDISAKGVLTGKLFEYLVSGTPILSIGITNKNAAGEIIEKTKTGKLFINKTDLKEELIRIFKTKQIAFYKPDIKEIEKFSRDKQVEKLINILNES
jgi:hypothetical protein